MAQGGAAHPRADTGLRGGVGRGHLEQAGCRGWGDGGLVKMQSRTAHPWHDAGLRDREGGGIGVELGGGDGGRGGRRGHSRPEGQVDREPRTPRASVYSSPPTHCFHTCARATASAMAVQAAAAARHPPAATLGGTVAGLPPAAPVPFPRRPSRAQ